MTGTDVSELLRAGLLDGVAVAVAGPPRPQIAAALDGLGAIVRPLPGDLGDEAALDLAAASIAPVAALVVDAATLFAAGAAPAADDEDRLGAPDELRQLRAAADGAWAAARATAGAAWIEPRNPGKLVLVAPRPGDGPHAGALRDALENLARTTSIEWARFGIRITAVTPGARTTDDEVATIVAYLVSPAGDYFSGARLDLS